MKRNTHSQSFSIIAPFLTLLVLLSCAFLFANHLDKIDIQTLSDLSSQLSWKTAYPTWVEPFGKERLATILARWTQRTATPDDNESVKIQKYNIDWRWTYYPAVLTTAGKVILTSPQGIHGGWYEIIPRIKLQVVDPWAEEHACALIVTTDRYRLHCLNSYLETLASYTLDQPFEDFTVYKPLGEKPIVIVLTPQRDFWLSIIQPKNGKTLARLLSKDEIRHALKNAHSRSIDFSSIDTFYEMWKNKRNWQPLHAALVSSNRRLYIIFIEPIIVFEVELTSPEPGVFNAHVVHIFPIELDQTLLKPAKGAVHLMSLVAAFPENPPSKTKTIDLFVLNHQSRPLSFWKTYDPWLYLEYKQKWLIT